MVLDDDLSAFIESPIMLIAGTANANGVPEIGRAVGARVYAAENRVDIIISAWQWPETIENVRATGQLAMTFARPADYKAIQIKGRASVTHAGMEDLVWAANYINETVAMLVATGLPADITWPSFSTRDAVLLRLDVGTAFVQTPGLDAGHRLEDRT